MNWRVSQHNTKVDRHRTTMEIIEQHRESSSQKFLVFEKYHRRKSKSKEQLDEATRQEM